MLALVLWQGLKLAAVGAAVGLVLALGAAQVISGLLYGVSPVDPLVLTVVAVGLGGVALLASFVPARRALSWQTTAPDGRHRPRRCPT